MNVDKCIIETRTTNEITFILICIFFQSKRQGFAHVTATSIAHL